MAHAELEHAWHISEYASAFYRATGFVSRLVLLADDAVIPPPYTQPTNPFCRLLARLAGSRAPCLQVHPPLGQPAVSAPLLGPIRCPMGLSEVAVPVTVSGRTVAIIYGGQVLREGPRRERFSRLAQRLTDCGLSSRDVRRLRTAYFRTPVLTERQYRAAVRLLTIFAHQLADAANGWIVLGHPQEPASIRQAKHFIQAHLAHALSTSAVAKRVHLNADRFSRLFRKVTGVTLTEYVNRARVEQVKHLLANPDARIAESALAAGFYDIAYFNRTFKRYTGLTPRQYQYRGNLQKPAPKSDK